jgi:ceramide glucosyltransferase
MITAAMAAYRCRTLRGDLPAQSGAPPVSILRPVCGVDDFDEITLRSTFRLDYPNFEILFCCADANDPAAVLVRRLLAQHPHVRARLLTGNHVISPNPKLNNLVKGWREATAEWIIMADSNVLMPRDYVQRLLAGWRHDTGVLSSPPIGCVPRSFWAEVECAFLNTYQARWQYAADTLGFGFAQGKTLLWRRRDLEGAGGIGALAEEIAEDAASTKAVRRMGLRATLVDAPFGQPLGIRRARQVWDRQARWSRLRRMTFPLFFIPEVMTGSLAPLATTAIVAASLDWPMESALLGAGCFWYGVEALLTRCAGWHLSWRSPLAWIVRDLMLPVLWVQAWLTNDFQWRGNSIRLADAPQPN